jgi:hypothetical protein
MSGRISALVCLTLIIAKVQLCWSQDLFRTNHPRPSHQFQHRKLDYPWLARQLLSQRAANVPLFDEVMTPFSAKAQKKDKTPLPDNPEARMTSVNFNYYPQQF